MKSNQPGEEWIEDHATKLGEKTEENFVQYLILITVNECSHKYQ